MPSIFNAQLSEFGGNYQVNNVILSEAKYILPSAKYVALPNAVALELKNHLNQGKLITIKKDLIDKPFSRDIPLEHFEVSEPDTLAQKKSAAKTKVVQRINTYTSLLTAFDIFEFFIVSNKLIASGFNVFDEGNKEEIYLRIIETGSEFLIEELERFLEIKDIFDSMMKKYRNIKKYYREIDDCDSEAELEDVIKANKGWLVS